MEKSLSIAGPSGAHSESCNHRGLIRTPNVGCSFVIHLCPEFFFAVDVYPCPIDQADEPIASTQTRFEVLQARDPVITSGVACQHTFVCEWLAVVRYICGERRVTLSRPYRKCGYLMQNVMTLTR